MLHRATRSQKKSIIIPYELVHACTKFSTCMRIVSSYPCDMSTHLHTNLIAAAVSGMTSMGSA
jgi:hypothetical protein